MTTLVWPVGIASNLIAGVVYFLLLAGGRFDPRLFYARPGQVTRTPLLD